MNKVNKGLVAIIIILTFFVLCLGGYIVYDKILSENSNTNNEINSDDTNYDKEVEEDNQDVNINDMNQSNKENTFDEDEMLKIVMDVTKKYFEYINSLGPYCGELDWDDYISFGSYETKDFRDYNASKKFNSINEIKEYYKSFMVEDLFPKYLNNGVSYIEQNGKLYCQLSHKGCGNTYNEEESYYVIKSVTESTIVSSVNLASQTCGSGEIYDRWEGNVTIIKNSEGNWIISKYNVEYTNLD